MEKKPANRREWIKNCIIVFLVIMLILTFFSNTIMNASLPEVTTAYVQSGVITEVVRGTGTVEASDPYKVLATENRKIASVLVSEGDHVEIGDTIFALEDSESDEIKELQDQIDEAELNYYLTLLSGDMTASAAINADKNGAGSFSTYINQIKKYDDAIAATEAAISVAKAGVDDKNRQNNGIDLNSSQAEANKAQLELERQRLQEQYDAKKNSQAAEYAKKLSLIDAEIAEIEEARKNTTVVTTADVVAAVITVKEKVDGASDITVDSSAAMETLESVLSVIEGKATGDEKANDDYKNALKDAKDKIGSYYNSLGSEETLRKLNNEKNRYEALQAADSKVSFSDTNDFLNYVNKIYEADQTINGLKTSKADLAAAIAGDEDAIKRSEDSLNKLNEDRAKLISDIKNTYSIDSYQKKLNAMKEKLAKLQESAYGGSVTAPVAGTVKNLTLVAGEETMKDQELFTIVPDGKGMIVQISVDNAQAKRIKKGDIGELPWRFDNTRCVVTNVSIDPASEGKNQLITFKIEDDDGWIMIGQNLNISVGSGSQNFDMIVPKAAVRSDNSGDYVLVIKAKNSPLGNRYSAKKVAVTKLSSDDNSIAISGDLNPYDYVVIQSNKIITDNQQVRLISGEAE